MVNIMYKYKILHDTERKCPNFKYLIMSKRCNKKIFMSREVRLKIFKEKLGIKVLKFIIHILNVYRGLQIWGSGELVSLDP